MGAGRTHLSRHSGMAMQGIAGDDAAFQNEAFERRERGRNLIAARRVPGRQRQPCLGIPYAYHQRRHAGAAAFIAAAQALAIDRDHAFGRIKSKPLAQGSNEARESLCHLLRIEQTEQPAETVMARRAMRKIDNLGKLILMGRSKIRDIDTRLRPTQSRCQRNEQHCRKIMSHIEVTRVVNFTENRKDCFHPGSPESGKPSSESTFSSNAIELYSSAIPPPRGGGRPALLRASSALRRALSLRFLASRGAGGGPPGVWVLR